jgi:hypothetical protein
MKFVSRLIPVALIVAVVLGIKFYNKIQASDQVRQQARALIAQFPEYSESKEYYDSAFERLHGKAFDQSYSMGGRRTASKFDENKYLTVLIALVQRDASQAGKKQIAESLDMHRKSLNLPEVEFN